MSSTNENPDASDSASKTPERPASLNPLIKEIIFPTVLSIIGFLLALYGIHKDDARESKNLLVNLKTQSPIVTDAMSNGLEFTVNGIKTNNVYLNEVEILNTGKVPIIESDFYKNNPISLNFGSNCNILVLNKNTASSTDFSNRFKIVKSRGSINILPTLINPNDRIIVKSITAGCKPDFSISASIVGIPKILETWSTSPNRSNIIYLFAAIITAVSIISITVSLEKRFKSYSKLITLIGAAVATTVVAAILNIGESSENIVSQVPEICRELIDKSGL